MKSQVGRWGNSLAVRIPKHIAEALNLQPNDAIEFTLANGKATLEPLHELPEFTLDELLDQIVEPPELEVDWGSPVGKEIW
ncbi:MAG: AbrB/MazE/SpoVT family DNA-binding domain-containing protein [Cyanobacteria bacterium J06559_1]